MNSFTYNNPTKLIFGKGMINRVGKEIAKVGPNILLVYGKGSIKKSGVYDEVVRQLENVNVVELAGVEGNPRMDSVKKGIQLCKENNINFILAVGGGSVIDCCKAIAVGAKNENIEEIVKNKEFATDALPYGSVVTISGSGAEMSAVSVISDIELEQKYLWYSPFSRAKFAIVDPEVMKTVPLHQTINGIVDSMSHILEYYFHSSANTSLQTEILETILRKIIADAPKHVENLENYELREQFAWISTIALSDQLSMGFIGDWGTHAIANAVGGKFDIAHGEAISIVFPNWMEHVMNHDIKRFKRFAMNVFGVTEGSKSDEEIALEGIKRLRESWSAWGAKETLGSCGINKEMIEDIPDLIFESSDSCGNFYRMDKHDISQILNASL